LSYPNLLIYFPHHKDPANFLILNPTINTPTTPNNNNHDSAPVSGEFFDPDPVATPFTLPQKHPESAGQAGFRHILPSQTNPAPQSTSTMHFFPHTFTAGAVVAVGFGLSVGEGLVANLDPAVGVGAVVMVGLGVVVTLGIGVLVGLVVGATLGVFVGVNTTGVG
jgi:hypothetical protein